MEIMSETVADNIYCIEFILRGELAVVNCPILHGIVHGKMAMVSWPLQDDQGEWSMVSCPRAPLNAHFYRNQGGGNLNHQSEIVNYTEP